MTLSTVPRCTGLPSPLGKEDFTKRGPAQGGWCWEGAEAMKSPTNEMGQAPQRQDTVGPVEGARGGTRTGGSAVRMCEGVGQSCCMVVGDMGENWGPGV